MNANNGWPGKPGVPLHPEKDGWHWVSGNDGDPEPFYWNGIWQGSDQFSYYSLGESCRYFGPVLLPNEAAALQARADRNAAGYARVDDKARLAEFLHKQEIAAKDARIAELEALLKRADDIANWTGEDLICAGRSYASVVKAYKNDRAALGGKDE